MPTRKGGIVRAHNFSRNNPLQAAANTLPQSVARSQRGCYCVPLSRRRSLPLPHLLVAEPGRPKAAFIRSTSLKLGRGGVRALSRSFFRVGARSRNGTDERRRYLLLALER